MNDNDEMLSLRHNSMAVDTYGGEFTSEDSNDTLVLAWTLDERQYLSINIESVLRERLRKEEKNLTCSLLYNVTDPYGDKILRKPVSELFSVESDAIRVVSGAGVISLLAHLAQSMKYESVSVLGTIYPDFPYWLDGEVTHFDTSLNNTHIKTLEKQKSDIIFIERPSFFSEALDDLETIEEICKCIGKYNSVLVIDESNANYAPAKYSAISLVPDNSNLIVLRGLSKAYGLGGLRFSYLVCEQSRWQWIRSRVPPLLTSTLSLYTGADILSAGDITESLRERIKKNKQIMHETMIKNGMQSPVPLNPFLPYAVYPYTSTKSIDKLVQARIIGKKHVVWPNLPFDEKQNTVYRLSVPLAPERLARFKIAISK